MLNLNSVLIFSEKPKKLSDFYSKVLDKKPDMEGDGYFGYLAGNCFISIGSHDKVKGENKTPERIMFNFETEQVKEEFERIKKLGALIVAEPYKMGEGWIATFADPDGNYFQLMTPWKEE